MDLKYTAYSAISLLVVRYVGSSFFYFDGGFSIETDNILANLIIVLYMAIGLTQLASIFTYHEILPFWDSFLSTIPDRLSRYLFPAKVVIQFIRACDVIYIAAIYVSGCYIITRPDPEPVYIRLAKPWTTTLTEARIPYGVTLLCLLPASVMWTSCSLLWQVHIIYA